MGNIGRNVVNAAKDRDRGNADHSHQSAADDRANQPIPRHNAGVRGAIGASFFVLL